MRALAVFLIVLASAGAVTQRAAAQSRTVVVGNGEYMYSVSTIEGRDAFMIQGIAAAREKAGRRPTRIVEIPVHDASPRPYSIVNTLPGRQFKAWPFLYATLHQRTDSAIVEFDYHLLPDAEVSGEDLGSAAILSQKLVKVGTEYFIRIELPLYTYDRTGGTVTWIDEYTLAEEARDQLRRSFPAADDEAPFYSSMPFVRRSHDLDTTGGWIDYGNASYRFIVKRDGMYALGRQWFVDAGVPIAGIDPSVIKLYRKGKEVPMFATGLDDGIFDASDSLYFHATINYNENGYNYLLRADQKDEPYPQYTSIYSDTTAYWIVVDPKPATRARAAQWSGPAPVDSLDWYFELSHYEPENELRCIATGVERQNFAEWTSEDSWFAGPLFIGGRSKTDFALDHVRRNLPGHVRFRAASWVGTPGISPNHKVILSFNSTTIDSAAFSRNEHLLMDEAITPDSLLEGVNSVYALSVNVDPNSYFLVDWIELEYPRQMDAKSGQLSFVVNEAMGSGPKIIRASGFPNGVVRILKVTPDGTDAIVPSEVIQEGSTYSVVFFDSVKAGTRYALCAASSALAPLPGVAVTIGSLRAVTEQAEYIIIASRPYMGEARQYASFIQTSYNLTARAVSVEDIYDNYAFGMFNPEGIKLFLYDAWKQWSTHPPKYVLMAGDANYNLRIKPGSQPYAVNYVPTYGFPAGDTWFIAFDSLNVHPRIAIGRLPVTNGAQLIEYLNKHDAYIHAKPDLWNKTTLHFSGGLYTEGEARMLAFRAANQRVIDDLVIPPLTSNTTHFYKTYDPITDFGPYQPSFIRKKISDGAVVISYIGHSGTQTWDNSIGEKSQLDNDVNRSPFITDFGCSTGKFAEWNIKCFAEEFVVEPGGQAIGYVGNSSLGFEHIALSVPEIFYRHLMRGTSSVVGDAHMKAKNEFVSLYGENIFNRSFVLSNTLIGDPAVSLPLPAKQNLAVKPEWIRPRGDFFTDADDSLSFSVAYANYGRHESDSMNVQITELSDGATLFTQQLRVRVPFVIDSLAVKFLNTEKPGNRILRVTVDPGNELEESDETDNMAEYRYAVLSTYLKVSNATLRSSGAGFGDVRILNPLLDPGNPSAVLIDFSSDGQFDQPVSASAPYGKTVSRLLQLPPLTAEHKYYWRAKLDLQNQEYVGPYRFWNGTKRYGFHQADSSEFAINSVSNIALHPDRMELGPIKKSLRVTSSGWYDGAFGAVEIDGINVLPTTFFRSYALVVLDSVTFEIKQNKIYDLYGNPNGDRDSLRVHIENLQFGEIAAVSTADEPSRGRGSITAAMQGIGSALIAGVGGYDCWSLIGWRGAAVGTVPETLVKAGKGKAVVDTAFTIFPDSGSVMTKEIGPAVQWKTVLIDRTPPAQTDIAVTLYGIGKSGTAEKLISLANPETIDISSISADSYPFIKLEAKFSRSTSGVLPAIRSWSVDYVQRPELALNYQSVTVSDSRLPQGQPEIVTVGVINAGQASATAFPVHVDLIDDNNVRHPFSSYQVSALASDSWHDTVITIDTRLLTGENQIVVTVDRDDAVQEQYEDNNVYVTRFRVDTDTTRPTLTFLIDGSTPLNGDYVRPAPDVTLSLRDTSPLLITSANNFFLMLNEDTIHSTDPRVRFTPADTGKPAEFRYLPQLPEGEHIFTFNAVDASGNSAYDPKNPPSVLVRVSGQSKMLEVYNIPNPFKTNTTFSFILTGAAPPEECVIKIYTIAGRMIKNIPVPVEQLRIGFNAVRWDGKDDDGDELANGVYFFKIVSSTAGTSSEFIGKMAVLR